MICHEQMIQEEKKRSAGWPLESNQHFDGSRSVLSSDVVCLLLLNFSGMDLRFLLAGKSPLEYFLELIADLIQPDRVAGSSSSSSPLGNHCQLSVQMELTTA